MYPVLFRIGTLIAIPIALACAGVPNRCVRSDPRSEHRDQARRRARAPTTAEPDPFCASAFAQAHHACGKPAADPADGLVLGRLLDLAARTAAQVAPYEAATYRSDPKRRTEKYCWICERNAQGRIKRNPAARRAFQRAHPCPVTGAASGACPGWIVAHIVPLYVGGEDVPENMQWMTRDAARAKDRTE